MRVTFLYIRGMGRKKKIVAPDHILEKSRAAKAADKPIVNELVKRLKDGATIYELQDEFVNSGRLTNFKLNDNVKKANAKIKKKADSIRDNILDTHLSRYEKIFNENFYIKEQIKELDENPQTSLRPHSADSDFKLIHFKLGTAFDAMKAKEKVLGLHKNGVKVIVSETNVTIESSGINSGMRGFNLNHLSVDEIYELKGLMDECRIDPIDGIYPLIIKKITKEIVVAKREDDEVNDDNMYSPIKDILEESIQDVDYEDISEEEKYNKKLDIMKKNALPLHEVEDKINVSFLDIVREEFKKVGAKI